MTLDKRALDNYITSGQYHREVHPLKCPSCEDTREVEMHCEYGRCEPVIDDADYCQKCEVYMEASND